MQCIYSYILFFLGLWIRDRGEVLAEALKLMLCEDRQHDMQKAAGFVKRLATFSLCFGSAESMAGILFMCSYLISYQKPVGMLLFYLAGSSLGLCSLGYIKASSSEEYQMPESVRKWCWRWFCFRYHCGKFLAILVQRENMHIVVFFISNLCSTLIVCNAWEFTHFFN